MSKPYKEMTDTELLIEIHRVEKLIPNHQNKVYLAKLHKERGLRKNGRKIPNNRFVLGS